MALASSRQRRVAARAAVQLVGRVGLAQLRRAARCSSSRRRARACAWSLRRVAARQVDVRAAIGCAAAHAAAVARRDALRGRNWLTRARRPKCGRSELMPGPMVQPWQKSTSSSRVSMRPDLGLLDGLRELGRPLGHHHVPGDQVLLDAGHLQHAAADREQRRRRARAAGRSRRPATVAGRGRARSSIWRSSAKVSASSTSPATSARPPRPSWRCTGR